VVNTEDQDERRIRVYTGSLKSSKQHSSGGGNSSSENEGRSSEKQKRARSNRKSLTHQEVIKEVNETEED